MADDQQQLRASTENLEPAKPQEHRRGSHLLANAGIDLERRRRASHQNDNKVYRDGNQLVVEGENGQMTRLEIIEVNEKMSNFRKAVPTLRTPIAVLLCIVNLFLPGIGTLIGAWSLMCCGRCRHEKTSRGIRYGVLAGVLQLLLAPLIVGWIYSIVYGVYMVQDAVTKAAYAVPVDQNGSGKPSSTKDVEAAQN